MIIPPVGGLGGGLAGVQAEGLTQAGQAGGLSEAAGGGTEAAGGGGFGDALTEAVSSLEKTQQSGDSAAQSLATGNVVDPQAAVVTVEDAQLAMQLAAVAVLLAMVAGGWWLLRLGLRPIAEVTDVADAIAGGDRSRRVRETGSRTEAGHLARAFNLMLDEHQTIDERLRRFVSDASHELRTPVAAIGGFTDLWRVGAIDETQLDDVMRRIGQEAARMRGLVERGGAAIVFTAADLAHSPSASPVGHSAAPQDFIGIRQFGAVTCVGAAPSLGRLTADDLRLLAREARRCAAIDVRLTPWRTFIVTGLNRHQAEGLAGALARRGLVVDPEDSRLAIVACSGAPACANAARAVQAEALELAPRPAPSQQIHDRAPIIARCCTIPINPTRSAKGSIAWPPRPASDPVQGLDHPPLINETSD